MQRLNSLLFLLFLILRTCVVTLVLTKCSRYTTQNLNYDLLGSCPGVLRSDDLGFSPCPGVLCSDDPGLHRLIQCMT